MQRQTYAFFWPFPFDLGAGPLDPVPSVQLVHMPCTLRLQPPPGARGVMEDPHSRDYS